MTSFRRRLLLVVPLLLIAAAAVAWHQVFGDPEWPERILPIALRDATELYEHSEVIIMEGCGIAVFRLSETMRQRIARDRSFLLSPDALVGQETRGYRQARYERWQACPTDPEPPMDGNNSNFWARAPLWCDHPREPALVSELTRRLTTSECMFAVSSNDETMIAIFPAEGYILYLSAG